MDGKFLGKISSAEFGTVPDYSFMFGLQLGFSMQGAGIGDGGKYTVNISPECKWDGEDVKVQAFLFLYELVPDLLKKAKVNYVSQLVGKPVEILITDGVFRSFRILEEVL